MIPAPLRSQVRAALERAWAAAIESGALPPLSEGVPSPSIEVERPANPAHGDLASNLAMKLARPYQRSPLELATLLAAKLVRDAGETGSDSPIEAVEVAKPGFMNIRLRPDALAAMIDGILDAPDAWGRVSPTGPRKVNVEFVSANPTGPLTIGNARGAFIGDLLSRVLEAGGQDVTREYYFNDFGAQIATSAHQWSRSSSGERGARGGLPRELRQRSRVRRCRRDLGCGERPAGRETRR